MKLYEIVGQSQHTKNLLRQRDGLKQGYQNLKNHRNLYTDEIWAEIEKFMNEEIRKVEYLIGRSIAYDDAMGVVQK